MIPLAMRRLAAQHVTKPALPSGREPSEEDALARLAARYVTSHGPAAVADFAWWTGLGKRQAGASIEAARGIRQEEGLWRAARPRVVRAPSPDARLLPAFDESAVAYKDRSAALARVGRRVANAQIGLLSPCVVVDGQMVGTWGRTLQGDRVGVALKPLVEWTREELDAIERAAEAYARFLGLDPDVEVRSRPTSRAARGRAPACAAPRRAATPARRAPSGARRARPPR